EESANFRGVDPRVEISCVPLATLVTAKQRLAKAPAATADDNPIFLDDEISAVLNELRVNTEGALEGALDLLLSIVRSAEAARGAGDQVLQHIPLGQRCLAHSQHYFDSRSLNNNCSATSLAVRVSVYGRDRGQVTTRKH